MRAFILAILMFTLSPSAFSQAADRYFDEFGAEIKQAKFDKMVGKGFFKLSKEEGRETHHFLLDREQRGQLNPEFLQTFQSTMKQVNNQIDLTDYIVVLYHPGVDNCNRELLEDENRYLSATIPGEELLKSKYNNPTLHIYKMSKGIEPYIDQFSWTKDPNGLVEKLFFPHHYPCGSFVVVNPEGYYYAFLGEYSISAVEYAKYEFDDIKSDMGVVEAKAELDEKEMSSREKARRKKGKEEMKKRDKKRKKRKRKRGR